jgi:hypothetical protein
MLGKVFNPFSLSLLAFFPLVAWQGGLTGLTVPSGLGQAKLPRRATVASDAPASGWSQLVPAATNSAAINSPATGPFPGSSVGAGPLTAGPDQLMAAAQPTLQRLQAMGAQYLRVEQLQQGPSTYYRCRCELGTGPGQSVRRPLEAQGTDPQSAALGVLNQVLAQAPADHLSYQGAQR